MCGVLTAVLAPACGGSSSNPSTSTGGNAGAGVGGKTSSGGGPSKPAPVECGKKACSGVVIPVQNFTIPGCCADPKTEQCGLDSSVLAAFGPTFPVACQPLAQPGVLDKTCPDSASTPVDGLPFAISFKGCCRPNNSCGYDLNTIGGFVPLGLGCVDSSPFLDGGSPASCGDIGSGGDGGAGGVTGSAGEPGAAGRVEPGAAGMAGEAAGGAAGALGG